MASFSEKQHIRSISLSTRSHPSTIRIEEELNKLKALDALLCPPTVESICIGLCGMQAVYNCMYDLLNLQSTQNEKLGVYELMLDGSIKLLDICSITKEALLQIKECVRDLQSSLRRRRSSKGDSSSTEKIIIARFFDLRKKMKKDAKKLIAAALKPLLVPDSHTTSNIMRLFREVVVRNISVFQSVLLLLSSPLAKKSSRWSLVSKLMNKRVVSFEEDKLEYINEFENADAALYNLSSEEKMIHNAQKSLEALENGIERVENGLEVIFRLLIKTRASLLNIISQQI